MIPFVYQSLPARVIFGIGSLGKLSEEITRLGAERALILSTPEQHRDATELARRLGKRAAGIFDRALMHVPIEAANAARSEAERIGADCCVTIGGGSTTGLAKAIALVSELPILAIPTTYAGSEMTPIWGLTEDGVKKTGRDPRVLPKTVIYDPLLTITMTPALYQRHQRDCSLCRSTICGGSQSDHFLDCRRRNPRTGKESSCRCARTKQRRRA